MRTPVPGSWSKATEELPESLEAPDLRPPGRSPAGPPCPCLPALGGRLPVSGGRACCPRRPRPLPLPPRPPSGPPGPAAPGGVRAGGGGRGGGAARAGPWGPPPRTRSAASGGHPGRAGAGAGAGGALDGRRLGGRGARGARTARAASAPGAGIRGGGARGPGRSERLHGALSRCLRRSRRGRLGRLEAGGGERGGARGGGSGFTGREPPSPRPCPRGAGGAQVARVPGPQRPPRR